MNAEQLRALDMYDLLVMLEKQVSWGRTMVIIKSPGHLHPRPDAGPLLSLGDFDIYPRGEGPQAGGQQ